MKRIEYIALLLFISHINLFGSDNQTINLTYTNHQSEPPHAENSLIIRNDISFEDEISPNNLPHFNYNSSRRHLNVGNASVFCRLLLPPINADIMESVGRGLAKMPMPFSCVPNWFTNFTPIRFPNYVYPLPPEGQVQTNITVAVFLQF
ncbi:MAG: hypothetical protein IJS05_02405 [Paludibacteraceae bacterium]|nr:hypothetical protein [Paludibacteraceae bacterium]